MKLTEAQCDELMDHEAVRYVDVSGFGEPLPRFIEAPHGRILLPAQVDVETFTGRRRATYVEAPIPRPVATGFGTVYVTDETVPRRPNWLVNAIAGVVARLVEDAWREAIEESKRPLWPVLHADTASVGGERLPRHGEFP